MAATITTPVIAGDQTDVVRLLTEYGPTRLTDPPRVPTAEAWLHMPDGWHWCGAWTGGVYRGHLRPRAPRGVWGPWLTVPAGHVMELGELLPHATWDVHLTCPAGTRFRVTICRQGSLWIEVDPGDE